MCGRTALRLEPQEIRARTGVDVWVDEELYHPSSNVAPSNFQPILISALPVSPESVPSVTKIEIKDEGKKSSRPGDFLPLKIQSMRWGLILSKLGDSPGFHPINARDDSVKNPCPKPIFSRLRDSNRCVVLAQGFYEWQKKAGDQKIPYYVRHKENDLLYLAALYNVVEKHTEKPVYSYTIITTDTTPNLSFLHDRIPILLDEDSLPVWLSQEPWSPELEKKVIHARDTFLTWYTVDPMVGKAGLDDPTFMLPIQDAPHSLRNMWAKGREEEKVSKFVGGEISLEGGTEGECAPADVPKAKKKRERKKNVKKEQPVDAPAVAHDASQEEGATKGTEQKKRRKRKEQDTAVKKEGTSSEGPFSLETSKSESATKAKKRK